MEKNASGSLPRLQSHDEKSGVFNAKKSKQLVQQLSHVRSKKSM